ncbi:hypothetical protein PYCC9005_005979 [Savitreella phatthalungensis]
MRPGILLRAASSSSTSSSAASAFTFPPQTYPSPYEIFHLDRSCSTSDVKRRYYELVKQFHPDRLPGCSEADNERFRKIVAANDLLTNVSRRASFDKYGMGWAYASPANLRGQARAGRMHGSRFDAYGSPSRTSSSTSDWHRQQQEYYAKPQNRSDGGPWDHFYTTRPAPPGERVFTSNANFMGMIAFLAAVGAVVQAMRLGKASQEINDRADKRHFETARDLAQSRRLATDLGKDERIRLFLAQRSGDQRGYDGSEYQ